MKNAQSRNELKRIVLSKLKPFDKHPFKSYNEEKLQSLAESIKEQGVIVPILVRPITIEKYEYEIVAGHNRVQAAVRAGLKELACDVRDLDDETATILMVDSNLQQRETILPSEKAWAYKYKLNAIKAQGKRTDLISRQLVGKLEMADLVGRNTNESGRQIQRFIRLTNLIPTLLEKVDERKLSFIPAVELSYLKIQEQKDLFDILSREEHFGVPLKQASTLKGISKNGKLPYEKIDKIIVQRIKENTKNFKVPYKKVDSFFPPETTPQQFENTILKALDSWFSKSPVTTKEISSSRQK